MIIIKEKELDEILEKNKCPECKDLIMENSCEVCSCYGDALCPFACSDEPWAINERYKIVDENNNEKSHFHGYCSADKLKQ